MAVENKLEQVQMLRALGSSIPQYSISEAMSVGHLDTVALLLELGGYPDIQSCSLYMKGDQFSINRKYELRGLFRAYGNILEEV